MTRLLALLCGLLAAVIGAELAFGSDAGVPVDREANDSRPVARQIAGRADLTGAPLHHWVDIVLARPLFSPDRKPVGSLVTADAGLPRLAGIIASSNEAIAIFQPAAGGKPVVARHGEMVGGWQVTTISAEGVSLQKADSTVELRPRFNDSEAGSSAPVVAPATVAAKQSRSRWEVAAPSGMLRARWSNPQLQP
jgi:hypothetical protein